MTVSSDNPTMLPGLFKVKERAQRDPQARFNALAHLIDVEALRRSYERLRHDAAVGMDGVTKEAYGQHLEDHLRGLHERLKTKTYRHQAIRRVHLPKETGTRPIGISSIEDKVVQGAVREVLEAIYEQDFLKCSWGFRPGRRAHDALRELDATVMRRKGGWVIEADLTSYFDQIDRKQLTHFLERRIADPNLLRIIGKCLHVGVLDGERYTEPDQGTTQGSILSPLLGNVYLHYVLDAWFDKEIKPALKGQATLIRYADDFVIIIERSDEAQQVLKHLEARMETYHLTLHPEKTRIVPFQRPEKGQSGGKGRGTFDFLGMTHYWKVSRHGQWVPGMKTRKARISRAITAIGAWCRRQRHRPLKDQHAALSRRLRGHYNYFGVSGNYRCINVVYYHVKRRWFYWLRRRSQRARRLTWERFGAYLKAFPLPSPRIGVKVWGNAS